MAGDGGEQGGLGGEEERMWDLNDAASEEEDGLSASATKEAAPGTASATTAADNENDDSSSSAIVIEASDEGEADGGGDGKFFGFSISGQRDRRPAAIVTHQFPSVARRRKVAGPAGPQWHRRPRLTRLESSSASHRSRWRWGRPWRLRSL